jgi:hypothetical protein
VCVPCGEDVCSKVEKLAAVQHEFQSKVAKARAGYEMQLAAVRRQRKGDAQVGWS